MKDHAAVRSVFRSISVWTILTAACVAHTPPVLAQEDEEKESPSGFVNLDDLDLNHLNLPTTSYEDPRHPTPSWALSLASEPSSPVAKERFSALSLKQQLEFAAMMLIDQEPSDVRWELFIFDRADQGLSAALIQSINSEKSDRFVLGFLDIARVAAGRSLLGDVTSFKSSITSRIETMTGVAKPLAQKKIATMRTTPPVPR